MTQPDEKLAPVPEMLVELGRAQQQLADVAETLRLQIGPIQESFAAIQKSFGPFAANTAAIVAEIQSTIAPALQQAAAAQAAISHLNLDEHFRAIAESTQLRELDASKIAALGRASELALAMKGLGALAPEQRKQTAQTANAARGALEATARVKEAQLAQKALEERLTSERVDLSLPSRPRRGGSVHPTMQVMDEMVAIFADLGFTVAEGPDVEDDWHNFTALNFPPKHPAREMHDTFFLTPDAEGNRKVLRTHTSPVQVRTMQSQPPPIRIVAPGRTFRKDSDQTHTPMFHQLEGLVIDRDIHMGHLKWTLETFVRRFFETDAVTARFRPHHFPFTEPSAEMDIGCDRSGGEIKIGQGSDWLEVVGCGMVHPAVLRNCGIDPDEWQGFAFGFGVDRLGMLKYGHPDIRDTFASDTRWLAHYGFSAFQAPNAASGLS